MTDAREALRERVAKAMWLADFEPYDPADRIPFAEANETSRLYCLAEADAAIAICFEEAEQMTRPPAHMLGSTDSYANGYRAACDEIAAALRAYVSASAPAAPPPASSQ